MGRSNMRGSPVNVNTPLPRHNAAKRGRIAVPALPRNRLVSCGAKGPPKPSIRQAVRSGESSRETPKVRSAATMCRVSSLSSRLCTSVAPWARAEISKRRLDKLFEPGSLISPSTWRTGFKINCSIMARLSRYFPDGAWHRQETKETRQPGIPQSYHPVVLSISGSVDTRIQSLL